MCNSYLDLITYAPSFAGQKVYCNETRKWYMAYRSNDGTKLLWRVK